MKKGFTLMELIIVVIIVGILAMIGLPQYFKVAERGRAAEAFAVLGSLRSAQLRYAAEASDGKTSDNVSALDMNLTTLKYFKDVTLSSVTTTDNANVVAKVTRDDATNNYSCEITIGGNLTCSGTGAPINPK